MEIEIWKDIPNYEGIYQISTEGRIKSFKYANEKILNPGIDNHGYFRITLSKNKIRKTFRIHKLVAIAFLDHIPNGHEIVIDHINGIKSDNRFINLRLATQTENVNFWYDNIPTSSKFKGVSWNKVNKKWVVQIRINGNQKRIGYFSDELEASLAYQVELKNIKR
jgi:hypothetical protein